MNIILATFVSGIVALGTPKPMDEIHLELAPAKIIKLEKPAYPELARKAGVQGKVVVQVQIDKNGIAKTVKVVKSDSPMLEAAAKFAALNGTYSPAMADKGAVSSWIEIAFNFRNK